MKSAAVIFSVVIAFTLSLADSRNVEVMPNPGCEADCKETDLRLLQVTSTDGRDQIIYMVSTFGAPTILTAHFNSSDKAMANVSWSCVAAMGADCITFNIKPQFTSTYVINRVIEYDDENDTRDVRSFSWNPSSVRSSYLADTKWFPVSAAGYNKPGWTLLVNQTNDIQHLTNATDSFLSIDFNFFNSAGRTAVMPGIAHDAAAGMFDVAMSDLEVHFNKSRFALELVVVSDALPGSTTFNTVSSVDDEYSPGVFEVVTWAMNQDATADRPSSFLHYKPVSYMSAQRNLESIQPALLSEVRFYNYDDIKANDNGGLTYALYGDFIRLRNVQSANLTIGSFKDGFYSNFKYSSFTAVFSVGAPVLDTMSADVIAAIAVGVGVPTVIIIGAVIIVITRMIRKRGEAAQEAALLVNDR